MIKYFFFLLSFVVSLTVLGQDSLFIGMKQSIRSTILKETRTYSISVPQSYYNKKYTEVSYPILYVLDGETAFEYVNSIVKFLSKGVYASIPELIVVGIHNTNRTKDMTPTKASKRSPDDTTKILFGDSGGNQAFSDFISKELVPHINSNFRTDSFRILMGHSFGGLAAANILLHSSEMFKAYLIHDPSFWWDHGYMLQEAKKLIPSNNFHQKRVFLSQAENEEKGAFDDHFEGIKYFKQIVDSTGNESLKLRYTFYQHEDHGTIVLPATFDGLKYIFAGYWVDFKKISSNKILLEESYKAFSDEIGHSFMPSEPKLDFIVNYFRNQNKKTEAVAVLNLYRKLYPRTAPKSF